MVLPVPARIALSAGVIGLLLSVINQLTAGFADPALQRAGVLASVLSVVLMLVGLLWTRITPVPAERAKLEGREGLRLDPGLPEPLRRELAWGSALLLTATPAAVLLLLWGDRVVLRRGLLAEASPGDRPSPFSPGPICRQAQERGRTISLVDLRLYPGRDEFEALLPALPSVVIQPLGEQGVLLLGGWSPRCFGSSDLTWLEGWAQRLTAEWATALDGGAPASPEPGATAAPAG